MIKPLSTTSLNKTFLFGFFGLLLFSACKNSEYHNLVDTEMAKGIMHDSIIYGFDFGIHKSQFFEHCTTLNSKKLITQATKSQFVEYHFPNKTNFKMIFFGIFNKSKTMTGMKFEFSLSDWSPWNEAAKPEQLIFRVKDSLLSWFPGNEFIEVKPKGKQKAYLVKVDGNRRITIPPLSNLKDIKVQIEDLRFITD